MLFSVLLALVLSIDCLSVGLSYGMRRMILPQSGRLIISCCSGIAMAISMFLGRLLEGVIPGGQIHLFGECLLVCLGIFFLTRSVMDLRKEKLEQENTEGIACDAAGKTLFQWCIPGLDVIVQILNHPQQADLDQSGNINSKEAIWLGLALAIDSFGAGIGIALMGFSLFWVSFCTLAFAYLFVTVGYLWGKHAGENPAYRKLKLLPGSMLIILGLIRILCC